VLEAVSNVSSRVNTRSTWLWIKTESTAPAKEAKGAVKEAVGKVTGDAHLRNEGKADKVEGKVENAVGRGNDAVREAFKK